MLTGRIKRRGGLSGLARTGLDRARRAQVGLLIVAGFLFGPPAAGASDTEITVPISTVRNAKGTVFVAVYERDSWLKPGRYLRAHKVKARQGTVQTTFRGLPPGRYSIAVFHDENDNHRVDTNLVGLPKEGYGFSRRSPRLRKPSFEQTAIDVHPRATAPIKLRY